MNPGTRPRFAKGVKLRRESDGTVMLMIPEGALVLNASAAATLELVDGERSIAEIVDAVVERFEVDRAQAESDVRHLVERLSERRFIETPP